MQDEAYTIMERPSNYERESLGRSSYEMYDTIRQKNRNVRSPFGSVVETDGIRYNVDDGDNDIIMVDQERNKSSEQSIYDTRRGRNTQRVDARTLFEDKRIDSRYLKNEITHIQRDRDGDRNIGDTLRGRLFDDISLNQGQSALVEKETSLNQRSETRDLFSSKFVADPKLKQRLNEPRLGEVRSVESRISYEPRLSESISTKARIRSNASPFSKTQNSDGLHALSSRFESPKLIARDVSPSINSFANSKVKSPTFTRPEDSSRNNENIYLGPRSNVHAFEQSPNLFHPPRSVRSRESVALSSRSSILDEPYNNQYRDSIQNLHSRDRNTSNQRSFASTNILPKDSSFENSDTMEPLILEYLSFALLGLDSQVFQFENDTIIYPEVNISILQQLHTICEVGLIYRHLKEFVKSKDLNSPIKLAFVIFTEKQLSLYAEFINTLFEARPTSLIDIEREVLWWTRDLRSLLNLKCQLDKNGYDFLSEVYTLTNFGGVRNKKQSQDLFKTIVQPYYEIIEHWILRGELIDVSNEFFIEFVQTNDFNDVIKFLPFKVPLFIPNSIQEKIFQIGKMLIFLNKYCKELQWVNDYVNKYSNVVYNSFKGLSSMTTNEIVRLVNLQYQELIEYLTLVIFGKKNELIEHLKNFRDFYFARNDDFVQTLLVKGRKTLTLESQNITYHQLSEILSESINSTSVKNNPRHSRLSCRILNLGSVTSGWDLFTIEYNISDLPINYLLKSQMKAYLKLFNFFWKLRQLSNFLRIDSEDFKRLQKIDLTQIIKLYRKYKRGNQSSNRFKKFSWIVKSVNTINLLRHKYMRFVNTIIKYLSFDIIEAGFQNDLIKKLFKSADINANLIDFNPDFVKKFNSNAKISKKIKDNVNELTIDDILNIHQKYLDNISNTKILRIDFVGKHSKLPLINQIYSILELIYEFTILSSKYSGVMSQYLRVLNIADDDTDLDHDIIDMEASLQQAFNLVYRVNYGNYTKQFNDFNEDLRNDLDLNELSASF